jgi:lipopolysaccharide biosynthesis glycosyltransferase
VNISIVIAVNKKDLWFCRICVASIRYYYQDVPIYLLKDELNGLFSTKELEDYWNVRLIEYPVKHFGWSAAKIHFYCDVRFKAEKFLVLDADIVFSGKLLDQPFVQDFSEDVIVSEQVISDPSSEWFTKTYFDYEVVRKFDNEYSFQGYTFNCGQLFCKGGFLDSQDVEPFFDFTRLPAWKQPKIFPLVDQSVFNYLLQLN